MFLTLRRLALILLVASVAACGGTNKSKFKTYNGPPITAVVIEKGKREMRLMSGSRAVKKYDVGLGSAPVGDKLYEGDGKTPEGVYYVNRYNPNSRYHLSVGISYPDVTDVAQARALGLQPGGDIFIHGRGPEGRVATKRDWTAGCIAIDDDEIEDVFAALAKSPGVPVYIRP